jgi:hypothetical protein
MGKTLQAGIDFFVAEECQKLATESNQIRKLATDETMTPI